jgi:hypothetical protein
MREDHRIFAEMAQNWINTLLHLVLPFPDCKRFFFTLPRRFIARDYSCFAGLYR